MQKHEASTITLCTLYVCEQPFCSQVYYRSSYEKLMKSEDEICIVQEYSKTDLPLLLFETHTWTHSNSMRLKVVVLIEYINLTTDVIDQKANSSSIIGLEGKTIAKWLCKVHSLGKQIWDPLKPWRLSSLSPTICGDCSKHLTGDLHRPVESQWETWQGARHRHELPLHFNYAAPQWLAIPYPNCLI